MKESATTTLVSDAADAAGDREDRDEAFATLCALARGRSGALPPELLARHVLDVTRGGDWPLARAGMDALLRRIAFAARDELRVASRPAKGKRLGSYTTKRSGERARRRPYRTVLYGVDPPAGSCDCPDYLRGSLGLCKHLLVVLDELYSGPRKLERARAEQPHVPMPRLRWIPIRSLHGPGDWLEGVQLDTAASRGGKAGAVWQRLLRRFRPGSGKLGETAAGKPERRLELVADLLVAARQDGGDPALVALLERERGELVRWQRDGSLVRTAQRRIAGFGRKLYPYQVEGVRRLLASGRLLLADDMGLGKTVQAIAACHILVAEGRVKRGIAIVPASLKSQWLREWQGASDVPVAVVDGSPGERAAQYRALRRGFLILGYEQLLRDLTEVHALDPDMVVLDEAQRIKNWETKTATYVKSLRPRYRLVLTGTPMENRLEEVASIFDWVDDLALEPKWRLTPWHTYADSDGDRGKRGARHLDTLRARMAPSMLRRVRSEVLSQLPPRTDVRVPVELTPQQQDAHRDLDQPIAQLVSIALRRPLRQSEFLRLMSLLTTQRIICNGIAQLEFEQVWPTCAQQRPSPRLIEGMFAPKLLELRQLVADLALEQQRKVVIFSQWRRMLRLANWALSDLLGDAGVRAVFFTGAESQKQRTRNVVEFHDDPRVRVMLLSDAGGVGLNLQRAASGCINLELPWNPAVLEQRIGRIYRLGQSLPIDIYNLVSEGGIESRIAALVSDKQALFSGLFDGTSNEVAFDGGASFASRIEKLVDPVVLPEKVGTVEAHTRGKVNGKANGHAHEAPGGFELADEAEGLGAEAAGRAVEAMVAAADESGDASSPAETPTSDRLASSFEGPEHQGAQQLLGSLRVRTTSAGGIAIEAPPESAAALATLFGKMAELLAAGAATNAAGGPR